MGGGQANSGQASQAANNANAATQQNLDLSNQEGTRALNMYNLLFGSGAPGSKGTMSGFLDPASLNVTTPTGAYKTNYEQSVDQIAKGGQQSQRGIISQAANNGLGLSSPFIADMARKTGLDTASMRGQAFNSAVTQQHSDAINNFWNASNIASGTGATNTSAAGSAATGAGSTAASIYGTAGQWHPPAWTSALGSGISAGGTVGAAAMCPAAGGKILTPRGEIEVERMQAGDEICQKGDRIAKLKCAPIPYDLAKLYRIRTFNEKKTLVGAQHAFVDPRGGYSEAEDLVRGFEVDTTAGRSLIAEATEVGIGMVYKIITHDDNTNRTYCVDGCWSLE